MFMQPPQSSIGDNRGSRRANYARTARVEQNICMLGSMSEERAEGKKKRSTPSEKCAHL